METLSGTTAFLADRRDSAWPERILAVLLALYILGGIPAASTFCKYHLDEAYYTDAALQMRITGDYLTPRWDDGRPRFHKPIYTYWLVAAGFAAGGPGLLSARLPFLFLGASIVWLVFVLARRVHGCGRTALLAAVFLLSNLLFMDAAGHALPDMLLLAGIAVSQFGFVHAILLGRRGWPEYLCAYGGMGLAIGSKGLSGLLPLLHAVVYIAWMRRRSRQTDPTPPVFRMLWHGPAIVAGAVLGLWWFAFAYARHGNEFLSGFWGDQFANKVANSRWLVNLPTYALFTFGSFFPWLALLLSRLRKSDGWKPLTGPGRACIGYALGFAALTMLVYVPGNITYERYMLPALPLLAVALAGLLAPQGDAPGPAKSYAALFAVIAIPAVVLAAVLLVLARRQELPLLTSGGWLVASGAVALWLVGRWRTSLAPVALGAFLMLLTFVYENRVRPTYRTSPVPAMAEALEARGVRQVQVVTWNKGLDSQLRVATGGTLEVSEGPVGDARAHTGKRFTILPEACKEQFPAEDFEQVRVGWRYERVNPRNLFAALMEGRARPYLEERREYFWLAERRDRRTAP